MRKCSRTEFESRQAHTLLQRGFLFDLRLRVATLERGLSGLVGRRVKCSLTNCVKSPATLDNVLYGCKKLEALNPPRLQASARKRSRISPLPPSQSADLNFTASTVSLEQAATNKYNDSSPAVATLCGRPGNRQFPWHRRPIHRSRIGIPVGRPLQGHQSRPREDEQGSR